MKSDMEVHISFKCTHHKEWDLSLFPSAHPSSQWNSGCPEPPTPFPASLSSVFPAHTHRSRAADPPGSTCREAGASKHCWDCSSDRARTRLCCRGFSCYKPLPKARTNKALHSYSCSAPSLPSHTNTALSICQASTGGRTRPGQVTQLHPDCKLCLGP